METTTAAEHSSTRASPYEGNYQVDISSTNFELEPISTSYTGLMRICRLMYVADHCQSLRQEILSMVLKYLQETHFTSLFKQIVNEFKEKNLPLPSDVDPLWHEKTQRNFSQKLEKLDNDLRNYRTNSIKDSIRRGHDDLGDHYFDGGDFFNAVRCYVRSRDYCVSPRHITQMCLNVIKTSLFMQNWSNVLSYVTKAEQVMETLEVANKSSAVSTADATPRHLTATSDVVLASRLKVYAGIAELATKRYKIAARHFLTIPFEYCITYFQDVLSAQTLIQYVSLCALATFDRSELHRLVIMSPNMKQYLELEPTILDMLQKFYQTSYSSCLALLHQLEPILALDLYLAPHLHSLYYEIRHRIIITYFSPYKNANMTLMAKQLNTTIEALEDELVHLIRGRKIQARIDSKNKILYVADTDQRWLAYQQALAMTKHSEYLTRTLLLRSAITRASLTVKDETNAANLRSPLPNNNNSEFNVMRRQGSFQMPPNVTTMMIDEENLSDDRAMN